jgi:3-oxoacyl-[acyl-carrier-protein] synthase-3
MRVLNSEIEVSNPEWRMADVAKRTGVNSRYWARAGETALDLGEQASLRLLNRLHVSPDRIDAVLFCTQSPDYLMPPNACLLQARLKVPKTSAAFDFSLACSGFVYGLYIAKALIESGSAKTVLLITAETYSKLMNRNDRGPASLFGDGAAATLISEGRQSIGRVLLGTDGSTPQVFSIPEGGARLPRTAESSTVQSDVAGNLRSADQIHMDGAAVLAFVQREVVPFVKETLAVLNIAMADLDLVVFHQASRAALEMLRTRLDVPAEKMVVHLSDVGNTVSASIPMALRAAEQEGRLHSGMKVLLVGFGVGLSWGACVVDWP